MYIDYSKLHNMFTFCHTDFVLSRKKAHKFFHTFWFLFHSFFSIFHYQFWLLILILCLFCTFLNDYYFFGKLLVNTAWLIDFFDIFYMIVVCAWYFVTFVVFHHFSFIPSFQMGWVLPREELIFSCKQSNKTCGMIWMKWETRLDCICKKKE